jgi:hypothetical protein
MPRNSAKKLQREKAVAYKRVRNTELIKKLEPLEESKEVSSWAVDTHTYLPTNLFISSRETMVNQVQFGSKSRIWQTAAC